MFFGQSWFPSFTQVPDPRKILDLQIRQGSREAVPIFFDFVLKRITSWANWVDEELSMAISRNLEGFRASKGLKHLVPCWSPSWHMFFFSIGELTITLEDVVNNFLLLVFGDKSPFDIQLSVEVLTVEDRLFKHFGGHTVSFGGKPAKMGKWVAILSKEKDKSVR